MSCLKTALSGAVMLAAALLSFAPVQAATLTIEYDYSFGSVAPDGPTPWMTAVFDDDGSAGSVTLRIDLAATVNGADVTELYFNLDPAMLATDLTITRTDGTGPSSGNIDIYTGVDDFKADGDGFFDIWLDLPPPPGNDKFEGGEWLEFTIVGAGSAAGLVANSFNFMSLDAGGAGPFLAAAHVQSTGPNGKDSDWIAPNPIPVPAAVWLFGSALGLLGWMRRKAS